MADPLYPLEGDTELSEVRFFLYENGGRQRPGEVRIRRQYGPDLLILEGRMERGPWKPILHLMVLNGKLMFAPFGMKGALDNGPTGINTPSAAKD